MMRILSVAIAFAMLAVPAAAQSPTVYDEPDIPPQAMDYDAETQMFKAHPGWVNDKLVHYYKFRMYVPPNYNPGTADAVPIMPLYLPSTDGTFAGVPEAQRPILAHSTGAGENWDRDYSDFVEIIFIDVPEDYPTNIDTSLISILEKGYPMMSSGVIANSPVVPGGSTLEDPAAKGTAAPIEPWIGWYNDEEVQMFVFESTSQEFADYINPLTRPGDFGADGSGYESTVAPAMVAGGKMTALPIWHVNQYFTGVTEGVNNGGPAMVGQRNVISHDRLDDGYSPLWQVWWATQVPVGYTVNEASHPSQFTEEAGFKIAQTPMFVNCPNIGPHGGSDVNPEKQDAFAVPDDAETVTVEGALIMRGDRTVEGFLDGESIGTTQSGMMGAYSFTVDAEDIAEDGSTFEVRYVDETLEGPYQESGMVVATFALEHGDHDHGAPGVGFIAIGLAIAALAFVFRRNQIL